MWPINAISVQNTNKKIYVSNILTFSFVMYVSFFFVCELFDYACFCANLEQATITSRIIIALSVILISSKFYRICTIEKLNLNIYKILGLSIIVFLGLWKSVYPDNSYDTGSYHYLLQFPGFIDYFNDGFYGFRGLFSFRLGDRLFYPFRYILGYRLGTTLNIFIICTIYLQIISFVEHLWGRTNNNCNFFLRIELWALIIVFNYQNLMMLGSYYVDVLYHPLLLEVIIIIFLSIVQKQNKSLPICHSLYIFYLLGLAMAIKLINVIYVWPILGIYLLYMYKDFLNINRLCLCSVLLILPMSIYLLYNYQITGNPLFPYYNTFFLSNYAPQDVNFDDLRWGGQNLFERFFWILNVLFNYKNRVSEIPIKEPILVYIGTFSTFAFIIFGIVRKIKTHSLEFISSSLAFLFLCLWGVITGYIRYFSFGLTFLSLIGYLTIVVLYQKASLPKIKFITLIVIFIVAFGNLTHYSRKFLSGYEWSWRNVLDISSTKRELRKIIKDREFLHENKTYNAFFNVMTNNKWTYELNKGALIFDYNVFNFASNKNLFMPKIDTIKNTNQIYTATDNSFYEVSSISHFISLLNEFNFYIEEIKNVELDDNAYRIYRMTNGKINTLRLFKNSIILNNRKQGKFVFFLGHSRNIGYSDYLYTIKNITDNQIVKKGTLNESVVDKITVDLLDTQKYVLEIIPKNEKTDDKSTDFFILNEQNI